MKIKALSLAAALAVTAGISDASACTNLIAGKGATADSSVMVTYAADSHSLYGELYYQPAAKHPAGAMRKVVEWDTGKYLGEIPEVAETYNVVGNMNEHQVVIAESTWGGRAELQDTTGNSITSNSPDSRSSCTIGIFLLCSVEQVLNSGIRIVAEECFLSSAHGMSLG